MTEPFRDTARPIDERVTDLLGRMTLREKVGQLNQRMLGWHAWHRNGDSVVLTDELDAELERWGGLGALYGMLRADAWSGRDWATGADPARSAEVASRIQERVRAASRWGIPALFVEEAPHGHQALGSQLLPVNLAVAATWDPGLLEEAATHIGAELAARGAHLALVSGLDMLRDPRWGRSEETFGEDPLLAAQFTRAFVRGIQSHRGVGAVLKHFAGQGAGIGGRNSSGAPLGPRELAEIHLPAARAGIAAGAMGVMAAYNDIDGVPCAGDRELLTGTLRGEWGFSGLVMADMFAVDRLMRATTDAATAGAVALRAGVDLSMCDLSFAELEQAVERGLISEQDVDIACGRVLRVKFELGLMDPPQPVPAFPPPAAELSQRIAAASLVLLHDRGGLLPADPTARVAVIGPNGDDLAALLGDYVPPLPDGMRGTVADAVADFVGAPMAIERGCELTAPIQGGLERAVALAAASDLTILVLGASSGRDYHDDFQSNGAARLGGAAPHATTGEGFDVAEVELPAAQRALVDAVTKSGTPTIAVIVSGRPLGIGSVAERCGAVVYAWYPGPEGGRAIAQALFTDHGFEGRLPVSLPRSSGTLPVAYNERLETTLRYIDGDAAADYAFGAGAQHGPVRFTDIVAPAEVGASELAGLRVDAVARNDGAGSASALVQLYARVRVPGILPRRSVLVGYTRVVLAPGEKKSVTLQVDADAVAGLGLRKGEVGSIDLWLSSTGAGDPHDPTTVRLRPITTDDTERRRRVDQHTAASARPVARAGG